MRKSAAKALASFCFLTGADIVMKSGEEGREEELPGAVGSELLFSGGWCLRRQRFFFSDFDVRPFENPGQQHLRTRRLRWCHRLESARDSTGFFFFFFWSLACMHACMSRTFALETRHPKQQRNKDHRNQHRGNSHRRLLLLRLPKDSHHSCTRETGHGCASAGLCRAGQHPGCTG